MGLATIYIRKRKRLATIDIRRRITHTETASGGEEGIGSVELTTQDNIAYEKQGNITIVIILMSRSIPLFATQPRAGGGDITFPIPPHITTGRVGKSRGMIFLL